MKYSTNNKNPLLWNNKVLILRFLSIKVHWTTEKHSPILYFPNFIEQHSLPHSLAQWWPPFLPSQEQLLLWRTALKEKTASFSAQLWGQGPIRKTLREAPPIKWVHAPVNKHRWTYRLVLVTHIKNNIRGECGRVYSSEVQRLPGMHKSIHHTGKILVKMNTSVSKILKYTFQEGYSPF